MSKHTDLRAARDVPEPQRAKHLRARGLWPALALVAKAYHVTPDDVLGARRDKSVSAARASYCWALHESRGLSYPEIGRLLGRDHSTVMHLAKAHWKRIESGAAPLPEGVTLAERSAAE